jgi:hypothetical protein
MFARRVLTSYSRAFPPSTLRASCVARRGSGRRPYSRTSAASSSAGSSLLLGTTRPPPLTNQPTIVPLGAAAQRHNPHGKGSRRPDSDRGPLHYEGRNNGLSARLGKLKEIAFPSFSATCARERCRVPRARCCVRCTRGVHQPRSIPYRFPLPHVRLRPRMDLPVRPSTRRRSAR